MKQCLKIYLDTEEVKNLKDKANGVGFNGRGAISKYLRKICSEPVCFIDGNAKTILKALAPN